MLEARGDWFADGRLTVADLKVFVFTRSLASGVLDHIPTDLVEHSGGAFWWSILVEHSGGAIGATARSPSGAVGRASRG